MKVSSRNLTRAILNLDSIKLHRADFESLLCNITKEDPCHDEIAQLMDLSQQCENLEIQVKPEDAELINRFNALSDQLSYKLAAMNAI
ncbi:hypothetical protein [Vibrio sp. T11.5]|uniref:hypothetical protein n=1 Tax=Vibrio sp. T11.5 TaxID=2998836 RepID=UPI0022CD2865|nr:hypothetical protein [Vibrio sp. T11.5]MDA0118510.1 hypothetical protein [Vibrio sp. T11.5]